MSVALNGLDIADEAGAWRAAGFAVGLDGVCRIGGLDVALVGRDRGLGIVGWVLSGLPDSTEDLDGVPTRIADPSASPEPSAHPNGVVGVDHVVLLSPDLARTAAALGAVGVHARRERDGELAGQPIRQVFFRVGEVILEVVGSPDTVGDGPSTLWGVTYLVADIDAAAEYFGDRTSRVKDAVQPGRRITTLRHRELDLSVRTALITPHVRSR